LLLLIVIFGFFLFELFVYTIKLFHLLYPQSIFLLCTDFLTLIFHNGFPLDLRWLARGSNFIDDIRVYEVIQCWWVELLQTIFDFLLARKFEEILEAVPLIVVYVDRQLGIGLTLLFVPVS
jgi:hypothetical protein